jgi:hypothetical protein
MKWLLVTLASVVVLSTAIFVLLEKPTWLSTRMPAGLSRGGTQRVLVFLVPGPHDVERVRGAVDPTRVAYSDGRAIALIEGRIVAVDAGAASHSINELGWRDRAIEIFRVDRADVARPSGGNRAMDVDPERMARLRELVRQPTLSAGEQMFVLQAMNDGIEF